MFKWLKFRRNRNDYEPILRSDRKRLDDKFLIKYPSYMGGMVNPTGGDYYGGTESMNSQGSSEEKQVKRIAIKPIDVINELSHQPKNFELFDIDARIEMLESKKELIPEIDGANHYTRNDLDACIERLRNRKSYTKFREFFDKFDVTTYEKVQDLLNKYKLRMGDSTLFIPELPKIAIDTMKEFKSQVKKLCKKEPNFYIIATEDSFSDKRQKRDPILLADNPFSLNYYILGVWDKEMEYLPEII